jgi:cell division protein YceG involved in septum cleavage
MGEIMKKFVVIIVVLMIAVSAIMSLSQSVTYGQSTTKPSAPQFTIQVISGSSLQLIIENQNFTSSSSVNAII